MDMNNIITYNFRTTQGTHIITGINPLTQDFYEYKGDNPVNLHKRLIGHINKLKKQGYTLVKVLQGRTLTGTLYYDLIVKKS